MQLEFSLDTINEVANNILRTFPKHRCFAFFAEMGTGKTTLIHALCTELNCIDNVSSPTFSIINEYARINGESIFHMDWYRLKGEEDAIEAGVQDILEHATAYQFIEWPEIAEALLPKNCLRIIMKLTPDGLRELTVTSALN